MIKPNCLQSNEKMESLGDSKNLLVIDGEELFGEAVGYMGKAIHEGNEGESSTSR